MRKPGRAHPAKVYQRFGRKDEPPVVGRSRPPARYNGLATIARRHEPEPLQHPDPGSKPSFPGSRHCPTCTCAGRRSTTTCTSATPAGRWCSGVGRPAPPPPRRPALRAQHHRRRRQDQRRCEGAGRADRGDHRPLRRRLPRGHGDARRRRRLRARHRAGGDRAHPADDCDDRAPGRRWPRLCRRGPRAVRGVELRRLRQTVAPRHRGDAGRRAASTWPCKRDPGDFVLWKPRPTTCRLGLALGPRPPGLAHRMLGDGRSAPRRDHRHPCRRRRPPVSAPRERSRAERMRHGGRRSHGSGCTTACSISAAPRWQVGGQHRARARPGQARIRRRRCATRCSPRTTGSRWKVRRPDRTVRAHAGPPVRHPARPRRRRGRASIRPPSKRRWTTTSTPGGAGRGRADRRRSAQGRRSRGSRGAEGRNCWAPAGAGPAAASPRPPGSRAALERRRRPHPGAGRRAGRRRSRRATSPAPTRSASNWPTDGILLEDTPQGVRWKRA